VILLGAAGAGKSTELLKLFFDCCSAPSLSPLRGVYAPLLLEARALYDRLGHDTYEAFLQCLHDALQLPPGKTMAQVATGLLGVLAHGMVERGGQGVDASEARDILQQFVTACLARRAALPGWWPLTEAGQRPLGMLETQERGDELDIIVQALGELCVMQ